MPRLVGKQQVSITYRHIIDSLVRKPGAFANYKYREEMFPTSVFRIAYDTLRDAHKEKVADRLYMRNLELAARDSQDAVASVLRHLMSNNTPIDLATVAALVADASRLPPVTDVTIEEPNLSDFDALLTNFDKESLDHATHESVTSTHNESPQQECGEVAPQTSCHNHGEEPHSSAGDKTVTTGFIPDVGVDQTIPGTASTEYPRPLPGDNPASVGGESQLS